MPAEELRYFFSYAREDSKFVLKLAEDLRAAGANVWLDQLDILGGVPWDEAVEDALKSCKGMIAVLSPEAVASADVMNEVSYALDKGKLVVPVLLRSCDVPLRLYRLQRIDFIADYETGFSQLLRALHIEQPEEPLESAAQMPVVQDSAAPLETGPTESRVQEKQDAQEVQEPSPPEVSEMAPGTPHESKSTGVETLKVPSTSQKTKMIAVICIVALIFIVSIVVFFKYRQAPALVRNLTVQFGTPGPDRLNQVAVDREGNIYLAGGIPEGETLGVNIGGGIFLVKHDQDGNRQWIVQTAPQRTTTGGLATDSSGNVHLATYDERPDPGSGGKELKLIPPWQLTLLQKFDGKTGDRQRAFAIQRQPVRGLVLVTDKSGDIYTYATEQVDDLLLKMSGPNLYKMLVPAGAGSEGKNRSVVWNEDIGKKYVSTTKGYYLSLRAIAVDASGGVYACGFREKDIYDPDSKGSCFVARQDRDGELNWMQRHGDNRADQSVAVAVDGAGNSYVVDAAAGSIPDKPNRGRFDVRLVKYDPNGEIMWQRQFGTELHDIPFSVAVSPPVRPGSDPGSPAAEVIYVTGITQGALDEETAYLDPNSKFNAFLVAFDKDGTRTFLQQFQTDGNVPEELKPANLKPGGVRLEWFAVSAFVATDERGYVYVAGRSETSLEPDYQNKGNADIFLMRFAPKP